MEMINEFSKSYIDQDESEWGIIVSRRWKINSKTYQSDCKPQDPPIKKQLYP